MEEQPFPKVFGHRVRRRRQVLGLTQQHVAQGMGMAPSNYHRLENGGYQSIQLEQLYRLVTVLNTSADYLLTLSDDQGPIPPDVCPGEETRLVSSAPLPATLP